MKTKSALSYFGSDSEVAEQLVGLLNHCQHVTIPFCGGMSILPWLTARAIVANDLNDLAITFYRVASDVYGTAEYLIRRCEHTLSHPSEMRDSALILISPRAYQPHEVAWAYWAQCWIGRKGKGGTDSPATMPSVRRTASGGTNASRIRAAANDLAEWTKHFERCEWECFDFGKLLPKVADDPTCGVYCDPPWIGDGDAYAHKFTDEDHSDLRDQLERFKHTTVVVRYGDHPRIRELYIGWQIIEATSRTQANKQTGEIWITNRSTDLETAN